MTELSPLGMLLNKLVYRAREAVRSHLKGFSWLLGGTIIYQACNWLIIAGLAREYGAAEVGKFGLALAIAAPMMALANMQLRGILVSDQKNEFSAETYIFLRLVSSLVGYIAILLVGIMLFRDALSFTLLMLVALGRLFDAGSDLCYGFSLKNSQNDKVSIGMIINGVASLTGAIIGAQITNDATGAGAGYAFGSFVAFTATVVLSNSGTLTSLSLKHAGVTAAIKAQLGRLFKLAVPMGLALFVAGFNENLPAYFLQHFWGTEEVGVYSVVAYAIIAGTVVVSALAQSLSPRLASMYANSEYAELRSMTIGMLAIGTLLGLLLIAVVSAIGPRLIEFVYGSGFQLSRSEMTALVAGGAVTYLSLIFGVVLTSMRQFNIQIWINLGRCSVTSAVAIFAIPVWGLEGAGLSVASGAAASLIIGRMIFLKRTTSPIHS